MVLLETKSADLIALSDGDLQRDGASAPLPVQPLLVLCPEGPALVDTGLGALRSGEMDEHGRTLTDALDEHGVKPDSIRLVFLTHLHYDHSGGLVTGGRLTFKNAMHFIQAAEARAALDERPQPEARYPIRLLREFLLLQPDLKTLDGDFTVSPLFRLHHTGGHTPGHQMIEVCARPSTFAIGDIASDRFYLEPGRRLKIHDNPEKIEQIKKFLKGERARGATLYLYHDPCPFVSPDEETKPEEVRG